MEAGPFYCTHDLVYVTSLLRQKGQGTGRAGVRVERRN